MDEKSVLEMKLDYVKIEIVKLRARMRRYARELADLEVKEKQIEKKLKGELG